MKRSPGPHTVTNHLFWPNYNCWLTPNRSSTKMLFQLKHSADVATAVQQMLSNVSCYVEYWHRPWHVERCWTKIEKLRDRRKGSIPFKKLKLVERWQQMCFLLIQQVGTSFSIICKRAEVLFSAVYDYLSRFNSDERLNFFQFPHNNG